MRAFVSIDIAHSEKMEAVLGMLENQSWCRVVDRKTMHMTMHFYGEITEQQVEEIKGKMEAIDFQTFDYVIRGVGFFPNENYVKVIWLGIESEMIYGLYNSLKKALEFKETLPFVPHVTIARVSNRIEPQTMSALLSHRETIFGEGRCTSIKLMKSELLPEGPAYTELFEKKLKEL